jgi:hypothetical protein
MKAIIRRMKQAYSFPGYDFGLFHNGDALIATERIENE